MQVLFGLSYQCVVACILLLLVASSYTAKPNQSSTGTHARISWITQFKQLRHQLHDCFHHAKDTWSCCRTRSLSLFEGIMSAEEIPLYEGVLLMATPNATNGAQARGAIFDERKDLKHLTWFDQLAMSLAKGLTTHTLQINLAKLTDRYMSNDAQLSSAGSLGTARLRRHRFNMIITMMFGVTALGAVLVPLGFQVLSVVSGKALLLAKMALLLASINGLKRVANTGLHYGLYHMPGEHLGGYYDRGDISHARNVPIPLAVAPTMEVALK